MQYAVITADDLSEVRRPWIEAYKVSAPDNSLAWYLSALEHFKSGKVANALQDLREAGLKKGFGGELTPTLQAMEELHCSAGRKSDEAKIAAFQASAQVPHLTGLKELAQAMDRSATEARQAANTASLQELTAAGLQLGGHLSAGAGRQTLINQLVGIAIEKKFIAQLDTTTGLDPFGRPIAELKSAVEQHQATLKHYAQAGGQLLLKLSDAELATYMERVKLNGEEAAMAWLEAKHGGQ